MAKVLAILRHDLRVFLTQRSNLPGLLLIPAVMTILIALVTGGAFDKAAIRRLDVIDRDGTQASSQFLASIRQANPGLTLCPMDNTADDVCALGEAGTLTEGQALDRVANSTSLALLEIPSGFGASLAIQQPITVTFRSASNFGTSQPALEAVQAALTQVNGAAVASQIGMAVIDRVQGQPLASGQARQIEGALYQRALDMEKEDNVTVGLVLSGGGQAQTMG